MNRRSLFAFTLASALAACGGGDDSDNQAPIAVDDTIIVDGA